MVLETLYIFVFQDERKDVSYIWRKDHSILIFRPNEIKYAALVNPGARNSHA